MNNPFEGAAQAPSAIRNPEPDIVPVDRPGAEPALMGSPRVQVDARGVALCVIAVVAFLYALQWSQRFLIPVMFSIFISYTLNPVVLWLERMRLPRLVGTTLVMLVLTMGAAAATNTLRAEFQSIIDGLPGAAHKISTAVTRAQTGKKSAIQQMQEAAAEIEKATSQATGAKPAPRAAAAPETPKLRVDDWLWAGWLSAAAFVGEATMVLFLVFFLLLSGDTFKRKLVKLTGPTLTQKKITVHILDDINTSIQNYMFMLLVTNMLLAALMWGALRWVGLENAGAWAVGAGLVHLVPYFGPLLITIATGVAAFLQFGNPSTAFLVAGMALGIATLVGTFVTTWMTGRIARMNPAAVFISLLFWGWLWGVWGLLLGVPIIVVMKVIAQHIEGLQSVAELLGE
jgi:predicted PurR-regulated permease PerM